MPTHFVQYWDVIRGKEDEYADFIEKEFIPGCIEIGLKSVGGFYLKVGSGPQIVSVKHVETPEAMPNIIGSEQFRTLKKKLRTLVVNYSNKIQAATLNGKDKPYRIEKDVWKYNFYFELAPNTRDAFYKFVREEYQSIFSKMNGIDLTEIWNVLVGGSGDLVMEHTCQHPADIGILLDNGDFRKAMHTLQGEFAVNFKSLILRTTERYHEPQWFQL